MAADMTDMAVIVLNVLVPGNIFFCAFLLTCQSVYYLAYCIPKSIHLAVRFIRCI